MTEQTETETDETEATPCANCGEEVEDGDGITIAGAYVYCIDCAVTCADCGRAILFADALVAGWGDAYCDRCAGTCDACGEVSNDLRDDICDNCRIYCEDCEEYVTSDHDCPNRDDDRIHDYGYKPHPDFHSTDADAADNVLFLGIEHELEAKDEVSDILDVLEQYAPRGLFYPKHDSSLTEGVEIVSHPMSRTYAETGYPYAMVDALARVASRKNRYGEGTAGVHIHLSRAAFSSYHLYKFLHFHYTMAETVQRVAGRHDSHWATFRPEGSSDAERKDGIIKQARGKATNYNRYQCVNVQNSATIELRYFRSTVRANRIHAYIQWALAVFDYTGDADVKVKCADRKREISEPGFAAWLSARAETYPHALALYEGREGY